MICILKSQLERLKQSKNLSFKLLYRGIRLIGKYESDEVWNYVTFTAGSKLFKLGMHKVYGQYIGLVSYDGKTWYKKRNALEFLDDVLESWDGVSETQVA